MALDLYCGGGGAALGLIEAGFEVVGVDIDPRHRKVYPGPFIVADSRRPPVNLHDFDLVWTSPPCQAFSSSTPVDRRSSHPNHIPAIRELLKGHPCTVIENVPGSPIRADVVIRGSDVGLPRIERKRLFELSWWPGLLPESIRAPRADWEAGRMLTVTTSMASSSHYYSRKKNGLSGRVPIAEAREVMGITTPMTTYQVGNAVPPPYARRIAELALSDPCGPLASGASKRGKLD